MKRHDFAAPLSFYVFCAQKTLTILNIPRLQFLRDRLSKMLNVLLMIYKSKVHFNNANI